MFFILFLAACINGALSENPTHGASASSLEHILFANNDYETGNPRMGLNELKTVEPKKQRGSSTTLWLEGVNFYFDSRFTNKMRYRFWMAVKAWEKDTCIKFSRSRYAKDRIHVLETKQGCSSSVGRKGGVQTITIDRKCAHFGGFAHEIGHALGFQHTHRRNDRDSYIAINWENVMEQFKDRYQDMSTSADKDTYIKQYKGQFEKLPANESLDIGSPYDYGSIMHYPSPSKNPTMIPTDIRYQRTMGSPFISFFDLYTINELYNCTEKCRSEASAKCAVGGFPHPRNCSKCICPSGYGGDLCEDKPGKCGSILDASKDWQEFHHVQKGKEELENGYHMCTYWIKAPSEKVIEISVNQIDATSSEGCVKAGVEIKANQDQRYTGYRFCDGEDRGTNLRSHTNLVPIIYYDSEYSFIVTSLKYRYVDAEQKSVWDRFKQWVKNIFRRGKH
ncbi:hypothetical protein RB195_005746 [Necator americanus]|uniref:Zinc metalloproteinase n=1 Tax=Necator americanus TaxID=51031 RepID=A0ABR1BPF4_NECAM